VAPLASSSFSSLHGPLLRVNTTLLAIQFVNGLQFGMMLFLFAAGLTLVFGIMDVVNLSHASFFMVGAYAGSVLAKATGSFFLALPLALAVTALVAILVEAVVMRRLYRLNHLDHVLATFGLILVFDAGFLWWFGPDGLQINLPPSLRGRTSLGFVDIPTYRLLFIGIGLAVAVGLSLLISKTRLGMLVRAAASDRETAELMGIEPKLVFLAVFVLGSTLAGLAGMLLTGITEASVGMGEEVIIVAFVVIVIGGIGSLKGAFVASLLVGLIDTFGRTYLGDVFRIVMQPAMADGAAPAVASMLTYLTMALVLALKPQGLFPPVTR
jgi:branched-chain amino acid transport system permease protein